MGSTIRHSSSGSLACCLLAAMAIAYAAYLPSNSSAAGEMMTQDSIKLASLSAYDSNHDYLGKVDGIVFKAGEPVFIEANFTNQGGPAGDYYQVVIEVRNDDTSETAALSSVKTNFAGQAGNMTVETYWKPDHKADYTVLVFLQKLEDLGKTPVLPPLASVRVQAV